MFTHIEVILKGSPLLAGDVVAGLKAFAAEHPRWLISTHRAGFPVTASWLRQTHMDGVLAWCDGSAMRAASKAGVPAVDLLPRQEVRHPAVDVDDAAVGRLAAHMLLERGFEHLGFCGIPIAWSRARRDAFLTAVADAGIEAAMIEVPFDPAMQDTATARDAARLRAWLHEQHKPLAVFAAIDFAAALVINLCIGAGMRVPEDVAVLGAGNHAVICDLAPTPIASIDLNLHAIAYQACQRLQSRIAGDPEEPTPHRLPPRGLVHRRSVDAWAYDDPLVREALGLIRELAAEAPAVDDLAERLDVSTRTLDRRFRRAVGRTPADALRRERAHLAQGMIRDTRLPLAQIAARCGYADQAHLTREIRRIHGVTPTGLRTDTVR